MRNMLIFGVFWKARTAVQIAKIVSRATLDFEV